jgi:hypothetical protein
MGTISGNISMLTPYSELEEKNYLNVHSTSQRCSNKIFKTLLIDDFYHFLPVSTTPVGTFELRISQEIF